MKVHVIEYHVTGIEPVGIAKVLVELQARLNQDDFCRF